MMHMTTRHLKQALLLSAAAVIGIALWAVADLERTLRDGTPVLVELAPVDPRSLMQGDYMALAFAMDRKLPHRSKAQLAAPRYAYVRLDAQGRATFAATGQTLPAPQGQIALRIRQRGWRDSIGPNAFFFQEGKGTVFEAAKWGELRVDRNGRALLVALRDAQLQVLGEQKW